MYSLAAWVWNAIDKQYNIIFTVYWIQAVKSHYESTTLTLNVRMLFLEN